MEAMAGHEGYFHGICFQHITYCCQWPIGQMVLPSIWVRSSFKTLWVCVI